MRKQSSGFTLIELLIVVAIIAILAMIAVPNFLEAQTRAKVSRALSDMRTVATAIEAYHVDVNDYPRNFERRYWTLSPDLTTPVSFITSVDLLDPFSLYKENDPLIGLPYYTYHRVLHWQNVFPPPPELPREHWPPEESTDGPPGDGNVGALRKYGGWRMFSLGPDRSYLPPDWEQYYTGGQREVLYDLIDVLYDPTNGTVSFGNIMRTPLSPDGKIPQLQP